MDRMVKKRRSILICALLAAATLAALWPVVHGSFTFFDDDDYIVNNPHVRGGLTWANVAWAFRTGYQCNWHPLTWASHILDVELFGMRPGWHHFGNLALHTANCLVLFLLLQRLTSAPWRSATVAAWFALHPLHVESVAWVAERKDVLSTLFFLLTLWAYAGFVESKKEPDAGARRLSRDYGLALVFFALGLMSKPMLVTLPFVLLLIDYWPLQRWSLPSAPSWSPSKVQGLTAFVDPPDFQLRCQFFSLLSPSPLPSPA